MVELEYCITQRILSAHVTFECGIELEVNIQERNYFELDGKWLRKITGKLQKSTALSRKKALKIKGNDARSSIKLAG